MTDKQRIKLVRLLCKNNEPSIRVLDKLNFEKNKQDPICYEFYFSSCEGDDYEAFIGVIFGEILRFEHDDMLWDSAMRKGEACPEKVKNIIDDALLRVAHYRTQSLTPAPKRVLEEITKLIKEIGNEKTES